MSYLSCILTVKSVVDDVNNVVSTRGVGSESALVLLDQILFGTRKSGDVVKIADALVRSVGDNLSGNRGVKSGHLQVNTDIGVVDIDNVGPTQVPNRIEVTDSIGGRSEGGGSGKGSGLAQELTALSSKLGGGSLNLVAGSKGSDSADNKKRRKS